jgi:molecular chaperone GrpE
MSSKHTEAKDEKTTRPEEKEKAKAPAAGKEEAAVDVPATDASAAEIAALRERVAALEAHEKVLTDECSGLKDQYLRKLADDENFRKRMRREVEDARKFANTGLLGDLVAILDDFDRAIASAEHARDYAVLHDGISLIRRQFGQMLANKYGLSQFPATGEIFDPNIHEAVASEEGDVAEAMVSQEFLPGYRLHERVIRSAKVKVTLPKAGAAGQAGPQAAESQPGAADADGTDAAGNKE